MNYIQVEFRKTIEVDLDRSELLVTQTTYAGLRKH